MTLGVECCIYDDHEYLDAVLFPISKYFDHVLFLINDRPWMGEPSDNSATIEKVHSLCASHSNMKLIQGHWDTEHDQRNFGINWMYQQGVDIAFILDGDEIHPEESFLRMLDFIKEHPQYDAYHVEWNTYWTKKYYHIQPRESFTPVVAVKPAHFKFTSIRQGTTSIIRSGSSILRTSDPYNGVKIPPFVHLCHHMSYAKSNESIKRKISIFSHAHELVPDWYENVWLKWKPGDKNLHPVTPSEYWEAVPTSFREWPDQLKIFVKKDRMGKRACTIIILNWDSKDLLKRCLRLIRDNTKGMRYNIIIVDNGSTDDSVPFLKILETRCSKIKVIYNKKNRGFGPAVNQAIRISPETDICLLNVDAEPQRGWLEAMYKTMVNNPCAGIVGPLGNNVASGHQREGLVDKDSRITNLHGFCMLILKEVVDDIGLFDERFQSSYEDNDYGMRAKMAGYELWLSAKSLVYHQAHQTFKKHNLDPYVSEEYNKEIYTNKYHSILYEISQKTDLFRNKDYARFLGLIIN